MPHLSKTENDPRVVHPISDADYATLADFRSALRKFLRTSEEIALSLGLTPQQHQALLAIRGFPGGTPPTIAQLAVRLHVRHNSAVGLVNRLARQRLVRRRHSQLDRRQVHVELTARGSAMLDSLTHSHRIELRRIGDEISRLLGELTR
jgi:DNA-binding MarR family transcriptional regulator